MVSGTAGRRPQPARFFREAKTSPEQGRRPQVQLLAFQGTGPNTTYQPGYPSDPANQPDGYYIR